MHRYRIHPQTPTMALIYRDAATKLIPMGTMHDQGHTHRFDPGPRCTLADKSRMGQVATAWQLRAPHERNKPTTVDCK